MCTAFGLLKAAELLNCFQVVMCIDAVHVRAGDTQKQGEAKEKEWNANLDEYCKKYPKVCVLASLMCTSLSCL